MKYFYTFILFSIASVALAKEPVTDIVITDAWVRATHAGQQTGAAYLKISSATAATLIKVETNAAKSAELHSMEMKQGVMRMRELASMPLAEKQTLSFEPNGNHIMLMQLKQPLQAGEKIPLKLSFQRGDENIVVEVEAEVRKK